MHRGSSKDARGLTRATGILPLSASAPHSVAVVVEIARAGTRRRQRLSVPRGTLVRAALKTVGQAAEGSAVLVDDLPIPLDTPIDRPVRLVVVPTFSGG